MSVTEDSIPNTDSPTASMLGIILALIGWFCPFVILIPHENSIPSLSLSGLQLVTQDAMLLGVLLAAVFALLLSLSDFEYRQRNRNRVLALLSLIAMSLLMTSYLGGISRGEQQNRGISTPFSVSRIFPDLRSRNAEITPSTDLLDGLLEDSSTPTEGMPELDELPGLDDLPEDGNPVPDNKVNPDPSDKPKASAGTTSPNHVYSNVKISFGFILCLMGFLLLLFGSTPSMERSLYGLELSAVVALLLGMLFLGIYQVFQRNIYHTARDEIDLLLRFALLWLGLLSASLATRARSHISIEIVSRFAPKSISRWVDVIAQTVACAGCVWLATLGLQFVHAKREQWIGKLQEDLHPQYFLPESLWGFQLAKWVLLVVVPVSLLLMASRFALWASLGIAHPGTHVDPPSSEENL
ncbi:MAG: TRAP transporter small permease subunit [Planctomycetota bacterium]|jgi:TRAP-type C4-dicarboxylate transport system permease small subunit|nr:TRAP transporter small permease subunit [Planctomycetota bacterium]